MQITRVWLFCFLGDGFGFSFFGLLAMRSFDLSLTPQELSKYDGEYYRRKYVACQGIVYDVTDCPKWFPALHENLHFPGQDLTGEFPDAPHSLEVFSHPCVKRVGRLIS